MSSGERASARQQTELFEQYRYNLRVTSNQDGGVEQKPEVQGQSCLGLGMWCTPIIPALLKQSLTYKANLGYRVRSCLKRHKTKQQQQPQQKAAQRHREKKNYTTEQLFKINATKLQSLLIEMIDE